MIYFLFTAVITMFFCLNFKLISLILKRNALYFHENKKSGKGVVVGYDLSEDSRWYSLIVKIVELNNNRNYICNSAKIDIRDYPKGSNVDVVYAISKMGIPEVYLADRLLDDKDKLVRIFDVAANFFLWITMGLLVCFMITVLS